MAITSETKGKIYEMYKNGETLTYIAETLKVSRNTIHRVIRETESKIVAPDRQGIIQDIDGMVSTLQHPQIGGGTAPSTHPKSEKDVGVRVLEKTVSDYVTKSGTELSKRLIDDLKEALDLALELRKHAYIYKADIEAMGMQWLDFVNWAFPHSFKDVQDAWLLHRDSVKEDEELEEMVDMRIKDRVRDRMIEVGDSEPDIAGDEA